MSVDPYMRGYAPSFKVGTPIIGGQIAMYVSNATEQKTLIYSLYEQQSTFYRIRESKNPNFPVGQYIFGSFGWRTHTVSNGLSDPKNLMSQYVLPDFKGLSPSLGLGVLGMPG